MKYLKEYATQAEYMAERDSIDIPNVILIDENEDNVIFDDYLIFEDPEVWRICCTNWGDYIEVVVTDNGDNTVNITRTPVRMKNTTANRGTSDVEENVDNTPDASGNTQYEIGTTKEPVGITKWQCEAVTNLGNNKFRNNTLIVKFNEFKYFTGLTEVANSAFYSATSLTEIILPDTVTVLNERCFQYCRNLNNINLKNIQRFSFLVFYDCKSLIKVDISNCTYLANGVFCGCSNLTDVGSIENIETMVDANYGAFSGTKLSGVLVFSGFTGTTIPRDIVNNCSLVTDVKFPNSQYTEIGASAFYNSGIQSFTVREGCTTLNNHTFSGGNWRFLDLPSTLTTWNGYALYQIRNMQTIVCRAVTPPTIGQQNNNSISNVPSTCKVYVPSASIAAYEADTVWSRLSGKYLPIEGSIYEH